MTVHWWQRRAARRFERDYAARSGVTVEQLHEWGRFVARCDCDWEKCEGWQMARASDTTERP